MKKLFSKTQFYSKKCNFTHFVNLKITHNPKTILGQQDFSSFISLNTFSRPKQKNTTCGLRVFVKMYCTHAFNGVRVCIQWAHLMGQCPIYLFGSDCPTFLQFYTFDSTVIPSFVFAVYPIQNKCICVFKTHILSKTGLGQ